MWEITKELDKVIITKCVKCHKPMDVVSGHKSKNIVWSCKVCLKTISKLREEFVKRELITL